MNDDVEEKDNGNNNEDKKESALVRFQNRIKERCYGCYDFGHKKDNCPKWRRYNLTNNNTSKRFHGNCHYCGKRCHRKEDFWKLKDKFERKRNSKNENTNYAQENESKETILMSFDENSTFCLFIDEAEEVNDLSERIHIG